MDAMTSSFAAKLKLGDTAAGTADNAAICARLDEIFDFMSKHVQFNRTTQHMSYAYMLGPWSDTASKLTSLFYAIAMTQSQPNLNRLRTTWQSLHRHRGAFERVRTMEDLATSLRLLETGKSYKHPARPLDSMWNSLCRTPGFGPKTAALFVKGVVDIHSLDDNLELRFLEDFTIAADDRLRLPVDRVMINIFRRMLGKDLNFTAINDLIFNTADRKVTEATVWDDLWFWGFITQHGAGNSRDFRFNDAKFWSIPGAPKDQLEEIRTAAATFIELTRPVR